MKGLLIIVSSPFVYLKCEDQRALRSRARLSFSFQFGLKFLSTESTFHQCLVQIYPDTRVAANPRPEQCLVHQHVFTWR